MSTGEIGEYYIAVYVTQHTRLRGGGEATTWHEIINHATWRCSFWVDRANAYKKKLLRLSFPPVLETLTSSVSIERYSILYNARF